MRSDEFQGTIAARVLVRIADFVAARGHDAAALCREVGVSLDTLRNPEARVPYPVAERLGERAAEVTGDVNIGLHLAQDVRDPRGYDAGGLLMMASPTIRVGLERLERYQRYWGDNERFSLEPVPGGQLVRFLIPWSWAGPRRHADECAMAEIVLGIRALSGQELAARVVRFGHAAPPDTAEHQALFRGPIEFSAARTELELDEATLDTPTLHPNEAYGAIFLQQVEASLARLPTSRDLATAARPVVRAALAGGRCSLPGTARALAVSVRTLQRRLQEGGTSFGELVDGVRRELAFEYLDRQLAVPEIAWLLGYADPTAFRHAFKRWTGQSPQQARTARLAVP